MRDQTGILLSFDHIREELAEGLSRSPVFGLPIFVGLLQSALFCYQFLAEVIYSFWLASRTDL